MSPLSKSHFRVTCCVDSFLHYPASSLFPGLIKNPVKSHFRVTCCVDSFLHYPESSLFPGLIKNPEIKMLSRVFSLIFPLKERRGPARGKRKRANGAELFLPFCRRISLESNKLCPLFIVTEE